MLKRSSEKFPSLAKVQHPFGPYMDSEIFQMAGRSESTRTTALSIYRLKITVDINGACLAGGLDNIDKFDHSMSDSESDDAYDGSDDEDDKKKKPVALEEDKQHGFRGIVEIDRRSILSDEGAKLLEAEGADLSVLDVPGGSIFVRVICFYWRYLYPGPVREDPAWHMVSTSGGRDPQYQYYRVATCSYRTYRASNRAREARWWLWFLERIALTNTPVIRSKRNVNWIVSQYKKAYPTHASAFDPPTAGPAKTVHRAEIIRALLFHAAFLGEKLNAMKPKLYEIDLWLALMEFTEKHPETVCLNVVDDGDMSGSEDSDWTVDGDETTRDVREVAPERDEELLDQLAPYQADEEDFTYHHSYGKWGDLENYTEESLPARPRKHQPKETVNKLQNMFPPRLSVFRFRAVLQPGFKYTCPIHDCPFHLDFLNPDRALQSKLSQDELFYIHTKSFNLQDEKLTRIFTRIVGQHVAGHYAEEGVFWDHTTGLSFDDHSGILHVTPAMPVKSTVV